MTCLQIAKTIKIWLALVIESFAQVFIHWTFTKKFRKSIYLNSSNRRSKPCLFHGWSDLSCFLSQNARKVIFDDIWYAPFRVGVWDVSHSTGLLVHFFNDIASWVDLSSNSILILFLFVVTWGTDHVPCISFLLFGSRDDKVSVADGPNSLDLHIDDVSRTVRFLL